MVHFKAIADDLGIKVTKLRKDSPYLGYLDDDYMIIALSIMTEKDYSFTEKIINKIGSGNSICCSGKSKIFLINHTPLRRTTLGSDPELSGSDPMKYR